MLNGGVLVEAIVAKLRAIPELVNEEFEGNPSLIRPYHFRFPREHSLERAIHDFKHPFLLVVNKGFSPISNQEGLGWLHNFTFYFRCRSIDDDDPATAGYYRILQLLVNGVPAGGDGQPMLYTEIHPGCYQMEVPAGDRAVDVEGGDYWQFNFGLREIGDTHP